MQAAVTDLFSALGVNATIGNDSMVPEPIRYKPAPTPKLLMGAETFERYHTQLEVRGGRRHPVTLVESAALAAVRAPIPKVRPILEPALIARGILSNEQIEAIVYAKQAFETKVTVEHRVVIPADPDADPQTPEGRDQHHDLVFDTRGGFMCADGMGAGKTRTGLGIIRAEYHEGRKAHVWISLKSSLADGVVSGWTELFGKPEEVSTWKSDEPHTSGIRFTSYMMLVRRGLDRFINTLGVMDEFGICESFDGVLILDEAHAGMNADPVGSDFEMARSASKRGELIVDLQKRLPNARVVYLTGTNAERADALAYAVRLGHIGPGASFRDNRDFTKQIDKSGTVAAEVVCQSLKAQGRLLSRTLSFEGVEYDRRVVSPNAEQIESYNGLAEIFRALDHGLAEECLRLGAALPPNHGSRRIRNVSGSPAGYLTGAVSALRTEIGRQALNAIMLPEILGAMEELLDNGYSVVMQIDRTGEAALKRALEKADENDPLALEKLDVTHRDVLRSAVLKHYPIHYYEIYLDEKRQQRARLKIDSVTGEPIVDAIALANRDRIVAMIDKALLPDLGHDLVRERFGDLVGEITGRSMCLVRQDRGDGVKRRYVVKRSPKDNDRDLAAFRSGKKRIMIISDAGGTGLDLHASTMWPNQQRRAHIIADIGSSATNESQKFARTHRTGQVTAPLYLLFVTSLPAHKRLLSTPTRKLAQLGALSRGQRDAVGGGIFKMTDNLETRYGRTALKKLLSDIRTEKCEITADDLWAEMSIDASEAVIVETALEALKHRGFAITVKSFLAKLMTASVDENGGFQQRVLSAFTDRLEEIVDAEIESGRYDGGLETWQPASATILSRERLGVSAAGGVAELLTVRIGEYPANRTAPGEARSHYEGALASYKQTEPRFYDTGNGVALVRETSSPSLLNVTTPRGFRTEFPGTIATWTPLDVEDAIDRWTDAYAAMEMRFVDRHFAAGDIMSVWNSLGSSLQIVRFKADDGTPILGRFIEPDEVNAVRDRFGLAPALAA